ncbi:MAG: hypothetical protein M0036_19500 [Desulfobacteraceae bacterium]|nr:hypothetical protein [Desulfobacteraceae bacterium]
MDGRPGIISITKGWLRFSEVNRVVYDPSLVTVEQMEVWLKQAGTYIRTESSSPPVGQ